MYTFYVSEMTDCCCRINKISFFPDFPGKLLYK